MRVRATCLSFPVLAGPTTHMLRSQAHDNDAADTFTPVKDDKEEKAYQDTVTFQVWSKREDWK